MSDRTAYFAEYNRTHRDYKAYYAANAVRRRAARARYVARKPGVVAAWRTANPDRVAAMKRREYTKNRPRYIAATTARKVRLRRAIPSWANKFFIEETYALAALRTKVTGFPWHVDHVIPLRGKDVCGLHVETNLAVIPAVMNLHKGNRRIDYAESQVG